MLHGSTGLPRSLLQTDVSVLDVSAQAVALLTTEEYNTYKLTLGPIWRRFAICQQARLHPLLGFDSQPSLTLWPNGLCLMDTCAL